MEFILGSDSLPRPGFMLEQVLSFRITLARLEVPPRMGLELSKVCVWRFWSDKSHYRTGKSVPALHSGWLVLYFQLLQESLEPRFRPQVREGRIDT